MILHKNKKKHILPKTSQDSTEAFLNKIKDNIHDPLPDPNKKSLTLKGVLLLLITLGLVAGAAFGVYYVFVQDNRQSSNTDTTTNQEPDSQTPAPLPADASFVSVEFPDSKNLFGMGNSVTIDYTVNGKARDEIDDFSSRLIELYLADHNGEVVGFVGEYSPSFGKQTIEWNPQIVSRNNTVHAPEPGQYRILMALRTEDESLDDVKEEYKAQTTAFRLEYDALSVEEFPFSSCEDSSAYSDQDWYSAFSNSLNEFSIATADINALCYSEQGSIVVVVVPAADERGYPLVVRFNTKTSQLQKAVYKDPRDVSPIQSAKVSAVERDTQNKTATVGRRNGNIIPILIGGNNIFSYNYIENSLSDN